VLLRLGLSAAAVQGKQILAGQPLVQWAHGSHVGQFGQQRGMPSLAQPDVGQVQPGSLALRDQHATQGVQPRAVHVGERLAPPQGERLSEQCGGGLVVAGGVGPLQQGAEAVQVDGVRVDGELVASPTASEGSVAGRLQRVAQHGDVVLNRTA
jgi:hypothetical protein